MIEDLYRKGIQAANAGDKEKAYHLFLQAVKLDPNFDQGWAAMGQLLSDPEKKAYCFNKALSLNPDNQTARQCLAKIEQGKKKVAETSISQGHIPDQSRKREVETSKQSRFPILAVIAGGLLGLFFIGGLIIKLVPAISSQIIDVFQGGNQPSNLVITVVPMVDLPATWTPSAVDTAEPDAAPEYQTIDSMSQRLVNSIYSIEEAKALMEKERYAEAVLVWDQVIEIVPEYAAAYYERGVCYLELTENQRFHEEFINYVQNAYDNFTAAIEKGLPDGEYYSKRVYAAGKLAGDMEIYTQQIPLRNIILEDILQAYELGNDYAWGTRSVGISMLNAGHCEEALDYFFRLQKERGEDAMPSATITGSIASCYICLEDYETALDYINTAITIRISREAPYKAERIEKTRILIALDRYDEALEVINELIEESPSYAGYRYYLRAYIYYKLGEPALAFEDVVYGSTQTWGQYSYRAYVLGRLALDDGDLENALYWLQLAEASFYPDLEPYIHTLALNDILNIGGDLLYPTPTPSPTLEVSSTPIPVIADHVYFTPTPPSPISNPTLTNYTGTGVFYLNPLEERTILFRPRGYHLFESTTSITFELYIEDQDFDPPLEISLLRMNGSGFGNPIVLNPGKTKLEDIDGFLSPAGYFYVSIQNGASKPIVIKNLSVMVETINEDGEVIIFGNPE